MYNPLEGSAPRPIHGRYECVPRDPPFRDDFESLDKYWLLRGDGFYRILVRDSSIVLETGPSEALYYSNAEISDGGFDCLRWWGRSLEFKARYVGEYYGSWGLGYWNYSMLVDKCIPLWFIHLRSRSPKYPLNGFYVQAGNMFTPIKYFTSPPLSLRIGARLLGPLLPIRITTLKPVKPDIDLGDWHIYRIEWGKSKLLFMIDGDIVSEAPLPPREERFRIDAWIDNAVFTPLRNDYARVYRHVTHENRAPARLEIDYISIE